MVIMTTVFTSLMMILLISTSLSASSCASSEVVETKKQICPKVYPLKIIFGNYCDKDKADAVLKELQEDTIYEKLDTLAKENDFIVHIRIISGYNVLVIEPIVNEEIRTKVMTIMKPKFENIYGACGTPNIKSLIKAMKVEVVDETKKVEEDKVEEAKIVEEVKTVEEVKSDENATLPKLQETQEVAVPELQTEDANIEENPITDIYLWLILLAIVSALGIGYSMVKSKKISDIE